MKIKCNETCKNAPKKELLKDIMMAFAKKDMNFVINNMSEDIHLKVVGKQDIQGKDEMTKAITTMSPIGIVELEIKNIITHGQVGAIEGAFLLKDMKKIAFSHIIRFTSTSKNAIIKEITSYIIEEG